MTEKTETTRRAMYAQLDRIRRAAKHRTLTLAFEESLEAHLEALREQSSETFGERMLEERNALQGRMHALDAAYAKNQEALGVAGDEIRRLQGDNRAQDLRMEQLEVRVDELSKQNRDLDAVVRNQRQAYAELYMENHRNNSRNNLS